MGLTGFFLFGFVVAHMLGNLQIFLGPEWLNGYAQHLQEIPFLLWPARAFLIISLIVHMVLAIQLAIENKKARPIPYVYQDTVEASLASRTMVFSGLVIFFFVIYHLLHFTFGKTNPDFYDLVDAKGRHDVYSMMVLSYQNIAISAAYLAALFFLFMHLSHGAPRFLQSLGLTNDSRGTACRAPMIERVGLGLAWIIFIGNCSIPLAVLFGLIRLPAGVVS